MTEMSFRCGPGRPGIVAAALVTGALVISAGSPPALASPDEARAMTAAKAERILARVRPRAENGVANAQYNLGVMYAHGYGVEQSWDRARHWYLKAARQNHAKAEQNLGIIYAKGKGVPVNKAKAAQWFRRAAHDGSTAAQNNLSVLYARGAGVAKDIGQAVIWALRAARDGSARAEYNLSQMVVRLPKHYTIQDGIEVRSEPNAEARIKARLDRGRRIPRLESREQWTKVLLVESRQIGWVKSSKLSVQSPATRLVKVQSDDSKHTTGGAADAPDNAGGDHTFDGVPAKRVVAADDVNVHTRPARGAPVKFQVDSGTRLTVKRDQYGWKLVTFPDGREGWIAGFLLSDAGDVSGNTTSHNDTNGEVDNRRVVAADAVNVHTRPARSAPVKFQVSSGKHLVVKRARNGWKLAQFPDGREGWVAGFLLK